MLAATQSLLPLPSLPQRLEVIDADDHRLVFVNGFAVGRYACSDTAAERVLLTQLAEVLPLPDRQIAAAFQIHYVTLSRLRALARKGGASALVPRKSGPKGPSKMTPQMEARCRALRAEGLSLRSIAKTVSDNNVRISHVTVAALFEATSAEMRQTVLPLEPATTEQTTPPSEQEPPQEQQPVLPQQEQALDTQPLAESATANGNQPSAQTAAAGVPTRYAGAMMLYAALGQLGLWEVLASLGANAGPSRRFRWDQIVACIVFCFALRFRSVEDWKNGLKKDLGVLIGEPASPAVLTMRTKVKALAESVDAAALSRAMLERYLALEPAWEGLYYVDGHFCPYHGQQPTPKGWDGKRRLAAKGHNDVYLHDAKGRALFFFSQPLNDSLARAIPSMVAEIRRAHGSEPFTVVFDRGGYSADTFRFLQAEGIGYITYLKGRGSKRRYALRLFRRGWFLFEGKRHSYQVYEKKTRVGKLGLLRTILFLGDDGQQIPVLTNLATGARAAKVVHCLRLRWRQENSFKFLAENYAIDQIIQYGADPEFEDRLIPNPKRKALQEQVRELGKQIQVLEAQLGRALDDSRESRHRTSRGLKVAHAALRRQIAHKRQALSRLENRLRHTPGRISAQKVDKQRMLLREDRRLLINVLKLVAANAERMVALRFDRAYQCPKDARSIFRALLHLPGLVRSAGSNHLEVILDRPSSAKVARALETLLADLNAQSPKMLATGPTLTFRLV